MSNSIYKHMYTCSCVASVLCLTEGEIMATSRASMGNASNSPGHFLLPRLIAEGYPLVICYMAIENRPVESS